MAQIRNWCVSKLWDAWWSETQVAPSDAGSNPMGAIKVHLPAFFMKSNIMRRNGFTVIEVLVAMAVCSIGVLGFAMSTVSVTQGNQKNYNLAMANALAQDKLEELKARPASFTSGGPVTDTISGQSFSRSWSVTGNSP